jgi:hypothetical protein
VRKPSLHGITVICSFRPQRIPGIRINSEQSSESSAVRATGRRLASDEKRAELIAPICRLALDAKRRKWLAAGRRVRCMQCLKLLRCQCERERGGILLYVRYGCRTTVCCGTTCTGEIT